MSGIVFIANFVKFFFCVKIPSSRDSLAAAENTKFKTEKIICLHFRKAENKIIIHRKCRPEVARKPYFRIIVVYKTFIYYDCFFLDFGGFISLFGFLSYCKVWLEFTKIFLEFSVRIYFLSFFFCFIGY